MKSDSVLEILATFFSGAFLAVVVITVIQTSERLDKDACTLVEGEVVHIVPYTLDEEDDLPAWHIAVRYPRGEGYDVGTWAIGVDSFYTVHSDGLKVGDLVPVWVCPQQAHKEW